MNTDQLIEMAEADKDILAAILFGSSAKRDQRDRENRAGEYAAPVAEADLREVRIQRVLLLR